MVAPRRWELAVLNRPIIVVVVGNGEQRLVLRREIERMRDDIVDGGKETGDRAGCLMS